MKNIMAVTPAEVQRLAKKYLRSIDNALLAEGDGNDLCHPPRGLRTDQPLRCRHEARAGRQTLAIDIDGETLMAKAITAWVAARSFSPSRAASPK